MFFTIKKPQSKRFAAFTIHGFGFPGKNRFEKLLRTVWDFTRSLIVYISRRIVLFFRIIAKTLYVITLSPKFAKNELVKKLIWSRGKLGRPIATAVILAVCFFVFLVGEFMSGFTFVAFGESNTDYLASTVDMIPKKETTVTEIPDIRKRIEPIDYIVEGGDNLYAIGEKFKVSVDALKYVNSLTDSSVLKPGQKITIPPVSGLVHTVKSGETLASIAAKYSVPAQSIADFNYILDTSKIAVGTDLVVPGAKIPEPIVPVYTPTYVGPANYGTATPSRGFCVWPTTVHIITQYFSWYHNGVDIATPWSGGMPPIFACSGGTVIRAGWDPWGLGLHVRIDHGNGYVSIYGHMSRLDVGYGQHVGRGQQIGMMGSTGNSTGPHVHFMVEFHGVPQNPLGYAN